LKSKELPKLNPQGTS